MRSHYVPRMYLKGWQSVHQGRRKHICVYKKNQKPEFKSLRQIAWRENYYTPEAEVRLDLERTAEPLLGKLIQENFLESAEKVQLSQFILTL